MSVTDKTEMTVIARRPAFTGETADGSVIFRHVRALHAMEYSGGTWLGGYTLNPDNAE